MHQVVSGGFRTFAYLILPPVSEGAGIEFRGILGVNSIELSIDSKFKVLNNPIIFIFDPKFISWISQANSGSYISLGQGFKVLG